MEELGAVLRRLRCEKGLTQAQVCGERLTRNMLSQIETGSVNPSLPTLCYLADRLEIPVSALFVGEGERSLFLREERLARLSALGNEGKDEECIALYDSFSYPGREETRLFLFSANRLADRAFNEGKWTTAEDLYRRCAEMNEQDPLSRPERAHALARLSMIAQGRRGEITDPFPDGIDRNPDRRLLRFLQGLIAKGYAKSLAGLSEGLAFENPSLKLLARAMICEAMGNDAEGRGLQMKIADTSLDPFLRLYLYAMSEKCCVRMNDFESAYRYAKNRQELTASLN